MRKFWSDTRPQPLKRGQIKGQKSLKKIRWYFGPKGDTKKTF